MMQVAMHLSHLMGVAMLSEGYRNLGNTCYTNIVVQCLLVLDKLRMWMLGPDAPTGPIGMALKELFIDTMAGNDAGVMLKPQELLKSVGVLASMYQGHAMQDSQEFLSYLRDGLNEEEKLKRPTNIAEGVPTVVESIFQGHEITTWTCKTCGHVSVKPLPFYELALPLPPKVHPTRSGVSSSPPESTWLRRWQQTQVIAPNLLPTIENNSEKDQTIVDSGDSQIPELQSVDMEKGSKLLEVDSSEAEQNRQRSDVDKWQNLSTDIVYDEKLEDSGSLPSIKDCLAFYFKKEVVYRYCENCSTVLSNTPKSKDGEQMMASIPGNTSVGRHQTEQSDRKWCLNEQLEPEHSAQQMNENQHKQKRPSDKTVVISKLPPVLTVHVLRFGNNLLKEIEHVKFEENLDVGPYVDPRYEDKDNSSYRLVGVIEHIGDSFHSDSLHSGHYAAYVRSSSTGSHQQLSSGSSSWFRARDDDIRQVSIEDILKCEAFLLFYERIER